MDKVVLKELSIFANHGLFDAEAELGQRFFIDVEIGADLSRSQETDTPEGTVNWADLVEVVTAAFTKTRYKMIEAAADSIAAAIFDRFSIAETARVEVRKPSAPIEAIFAYTSVIVERTREGTK
ncbi:dihydroneopterin aldolase [Hansschlegelia zhihuaiae]|uniref:7,8-dihydroneopterin aldolase n=1 Tax=Hansschlegelia zhihuaiae TaxID=405005 RepID=A0A4Q0ML92_9HYPH|nr:dihydroneopterin aldolase [Hansschlegelia zhihuaiae]RXF74444.1 dihydroneopterin aldolase [Hansschlegelia zhihuaiae]